MEDASKPASNGPKATKDINNKMETAKDCTGVGAMGRGNKEAKDDLHVDNTSPRKVET